MSLLFSSLLLEKSMVVAIYIHISASKLDNNYLVYHLIILGNTCNVLRKINVSIYSINKEADYCLLKAHKMHKCLFAVKCN